MSKQTRNKILALMAKYGLTGFSALFGMLLMLLSGAQVIPYPDMMWVGLAVWIASMLYVWTMGILQFIYKRPFISIADGYMGVEDAKMNRNIKKQKQEN